MSKKSVEIHTVQAKAIKTLVELLKDILPEANIECNANGLRILATDPSKTKLIHLKLESDKFDSYHCDKKKILGIRMMDFQKFIRSMTDNDNLTTYFEESESDEEKLGIQIANGDKNKVRNIKLRLIDVDEQVINCPPAQFDSIITMPSDEFQKTCRDLLNISELVEIKNVGKQLIFHCEGDIGEETVYMGEVGQGLTFLKNSTSTEIIQGFYDLKALALFTKCTNISPHVELYMQNDYPLVIQYQIGSLGTLKLALAPKVVK